MDAASQAIAGGTEDVGAQLSRLQSDLNGIKEALAGIGKAQASGTCNCAACAEEAGKVVQHAKDEVRAAISGLETYARQNPGYVLGGAVGVGVVLGMLLRRH